MRKRSVYMNSKTEFVLDKTSNIDIDAGIYNNFNIESGNIVE